MYIPKALRKENCFVDVAIPSNASLMSRIGLTSVPDSAYSGDDEVPIYQDKIDQIEAFKAYAESENAKDSAK